MREVAIRIAGGSHALVDLKDLHLVPGNIFGGQFAQHDPGRMAAAERDVEAAARRDGLRGIGGNECGSTFGDCFGIRQGFRLCMAPPLGIDRSCLPGVDDLRIGSFGILPAALGGESFAASAGPQVPGS